MDTATRKKKAKAFGRALQKARQKAGMTQEKLAERADISPDYVQAIERGSRLPNVAIADELRRALDAGWDDLLP